MERQSPDSGYAAEIQRVVDQTVLYDLMTLAADTNAASQTRAIATLKLDELKNWLGQQPRRHRMKAGARRIFTAAEQIKQFQTDPKQIELTKPAVPPDGQPIGEDDGWDDDANLALDRPKDKLVYCKGHCCPMLFCMLAIANTAYRMRRRAKRVVLKD